MIGLRFLAGAVALLLAAPVDADRLSVSLGSRHLGASGFEEVNPGVFYTFERPATDVSLGVYRNSFGTASAIVTAAWPVLDLRHGQLSVFAGAAHYPGDGDQFLFGWGDIVPVAGLQLRHRQTFLQLMPGDGMAVLAFGLTFDLTGR